MDKLRRGILQGLVLFLVFVLSLSVTALFQNTRATENRQEMSDPVLPELMVEFDGNLANRMCGYARPMRTDFIRDCITPLDTTKSLSFVINPYQTVVTSLAYEIRTCDGSKVIENRKIKVLTPDAGMLRTTVQIASDLLLNQEYSMQITLETSQGNCYYYTRVIARSNLATSSYVAFVRDFVEKCLDDQNADEIATYLEQTTDTGTNYSNITLHSTFDQITWGGLTPKMWIRGIPVVKDINEVTCSIVMEYELVSYDEGGNQELYSVREFYRMKMSSGKVLILDFLRSATRAFSPTVDSVTAEGLILGVRDRAVTLRTNPETGVTAFVQNGELWTFSPSDGKATLIFTFRRSDGDFRDVRANHDIQIIRVDENGDVDFVVYGYMNRGEREGYSGVCVYHYNNDRGDIQEKVFIPTQESWEFLARDLSKLSYVSTDGRFFLLFGGSLYQVNTREGSFSVLEEGIDPEEFASSDTGQHAAWMMQSGDYAGQIKEIDFETGSVRYIRAKDSRELRLVGFMNEDVIYGFVRGEDILTDEVGHVWEGVSSLLIENFGGEVLKKYKPEDGQYLTDFSLGTMLLEFWISEKSGQTYKQIKKENIMNNSREANAFASVELTGSSRAGTEVRLAFANAPMTSEPLIIQAKIRSSDDRTITLANVTLDQERYYVYAFGRLEGIYTDPAEAVARANAKLGVVLNSTQQYVWERGNQKTSTQIRLDEIPAGWKLGSVDKEFLTQALEGKATLLDLSGCDLDMMLYEISASRPVIARTGVGVGVLIVGYDEFNTWLFDPLKGEPYAFSMDESVELFEKAGNVFFLAMENLI